jgi:hypothetical protein
MGGSKLGLDLKYQNAKSVAFEFADVFEDRVEIALLDQYLADADVSPFAAHVGKLLDADQLFVTTAALKSTKITVEARRSKDTGLDVSVPEIQKVVGGNVIGGREATEGDTRQRPLLLLQAARLLRGRAPSRWFEHHRRCPWLPATPQTPGQGAVRREP